MKRFSSTLWVFLLLPRAGVAADFDSAAIDRLVREARNVWDVPGVAVGIVRGDNVYFKCDGVRDLRTADPVTPDTLFPISSCTKAFTTTAMAMLVDEGKMNWDDPVRKHVPFFHLSDPLADGDVRLRDLVTHRTGVGSHELLWYRSPWSQREIIEKIGKVPLAYPFRSHFHYQTTMFQTAGWAVGTASQSSWAEFVHERIFKPLEMSAALTTEEAFKLRDRASPYRILDRGAPDAIPLYVMKEPDPAGSVHASARDLAKWVRFQLGDGTWNGKRLVSTENLHETHSPQTIIRMEGAAKALNPETLQMSYGMGWVIQDYRGRLLLAHGGVIDGFKAHITLLPKEKIGLVILANLQETRMNLALSNALVDLLLGLPRRNWNEFIQEQLKKDADAARERFQKVMAQHREGTKPSLQLSTYAGRYEHPAYGAAEIKLTNGTLVWKWSTFEDALIHFEDDTFLIHNDILGRPRVTFTSADGNVAAMIVSEPVGVQFRKVK